ncbi:MAG TPA: hypothetical protein VFV10_08710 [Gammaproteobacteria bacterium]|nr:hypothetical protein [Gammaproteobacteria bacterium]
MTTTLQSLDEMVRRAAERRRSERWRALLAVLLPAAVGAVFLAYGSMQLKSASQQVAALHDEARKSEERIAALSAEVDARTKTIATLEQRTAELQKQLEQTAALARYAHPMDLVDLKTIYSRTPPRVAAALGTILDLRSRNVSWSLGGTDPSRGFDSPSFAAFVLKEHGALPPDAAGDGDLSQRSRRLLASLPQADTPQPGDLVFYPAGYALFWFQDQRNRPFVIGMSPSGIVALEPDFAQRLGVRRPAYR